MSQRSVSGKCTQQIEGIVNKRGIEKSERQRERGKNRQQNEATGMYIFVQR